MDAFILPLIGGLLIGLSASLLLYLNGSIAGISGLLWRSLSSRHVTSACFIIGLPLGAWLYHAVADISVPITSTSLPLAAIGGLLVGIGVKIGNGCTSGHGVCGIGRLSKRSIVATMTFMLTGIITVTVMERLL